MDNEETKILGPQQNEVQKQEEQQQESAQIAMSADKKASEKKAGAKKFAARFAATAAGAALGTGAAMAADHVAYGTGQQPSEQEKLAPTEDDAEAKDDAEVGKADAEEAVATAQTTNDEAQAAVANEEPAAQTYTAQATDAQAAVLAVEAPSEQEAVVLTDEGMRVAQVDDSLSFSQAFAEARAQVGAGGVFEWHGKVYNTFSQNEWRDMTAADRAEWQSRVDYSDVTDSAHSNLYATHHTSSGHAHTAHAEAVDEVPQNASYIDHSAQETADAGGDDEVHVIGVAVHDNGQGGMATIAGLQSGDDMALLVDVDSDGTVDYVVHDDNGNGHYESNEWHDVSADGMATTDVVDAYMGEAQQHGVDAVVTNLDSGEQYHITPTDDGYGLTSIDDTTPDVDTQMACNDDMPDYMNDADMGVMDV